MATYKKNYARATYDSNGAVLTTIVSIFSTSGGTVIETTLKGDHLSKSEDEIVQLALDQFYQDTPGKVTMRIVKNDGYTQMDETAIRHALEEKLGEFLHLDFSYVDAVEPSKNGKFRYVISKL